jgi:hypothetical protein
MTLPRKLYAPYYALNDVSSDCLTPSFSNGSLSTFLMVRGVPIDKLTNHFLIRCVMPLGLFLKEFKTLDFFKASVTLTDGVILYPFWKHIVKYAASLHTHQYLGFDTALPVPTISAFILSCLPEHFQCGGPGSTTSLQPEHKEPAKSMSRQMPYQWLWHR